MNAGRTPPPELHLPDLPEVPVQLGAAPEPPGPPRPKQPWFWRLRELLASYLPLLLMALLAAGTWWLVRNTPQPPRPGPEPPPRQTPDYTMSGFSVARFGADGQLVLRIEGDQLRHIPATRQMLIDGVRVHGVGAAGRSTDAQARGAVAMDDGSWVELTGGAQVISRKPDEPPLQIRGESLRLEPRTERLRSDRPVVVTRDGSEIHAAGLDYDHASGVLQLRGPLRMSLPPPAAGSAAP